MQEYFWWSETPAADFALIQISRLTLEPTQYHGFFHWVKAATDLHPLPRSRMSGDIPLFPPHAFIAWTDSTLPDYCIVVVLVVIIFITIGLSWTAVLVQTWWFLYYMHRLYEGLGVSIDSKLYCHYHAHYVFFQSAKAPRSHSYYNIIHLNSQESIYVVCYLH
jgi:hypothetical protein